MAVDPRTPVIVGVGQFTENIDDPGYRGMSAVELATEAARAGAGRQRRRYRRRRQSRSTWSSVCGSSRSRPVCPRRWASRTTIRGR